MKEKPRGRTIDRGNVQPEWIDVNGHMNVAYYTLVFDLAVDTLWREFGITEQHIQEHSSSTFAVESHIVYNRELKVGEPYVVTVEILAFDAKRIHQLQRLYHAEQGFLAGTAEWMTLHVDLRSRRVAPWPDQVLKRINRIARSQPPSKLDPIVGHRMAVPDPLYRLGEAHG